MDGRLYLALAELTRGVAGASAWRTARRLAAASIGSSAPNPLDSYLVYVDAVREVLAVPEPELLRAVGRWAATSPPGGSVMTTVHEGEPGLLALVHQHVRRVLPGQPPPDCIHVEVPSGGLLMLYQLVDPRLQPLIVGLVEGIADQLRVGVHAATLVAVPDARATHVAFTISYPNPAGALPHTD